MVDVKKDVKEVVKDVKSEVKKAEKDVELCWNCKNNSEDSPLVDGKCPKCGFDKNLIKR